MDDQVKRLNFNISERAHADVTALARSSRRSITEVVRLGLGLAKIAIEAESKGHRLIIANQAGDALKEVVIPNA